MVYIVNHNKSVCSDICESLIELYKDIQHKPSEVYSYYGLQGNENKTVDLPKDLYIRHEYIKSGLSSFKKLHGTIEDVYESLYLNY